jgi:hypothetical protein
MSGQAIDPPADETPKERKARLRKEAERVSEKIDEQIRQERELSKMKKVVKVLLLGQAESGMSGHFLCVTLALPLLCCKPLQANQSLLKVHSYHFYIAIIELMFSRRLANDVFCGMPGR